MSKKILEAIASGEELVKPVANALLNKESVKVSQLLQKSEGKDVKISSEKCTGKFYAVYGPNLKSAIGNNFVNYLRMFMMKHQQVSKLTSCTKVKVQLIQVCLWGWPAVKDIHGYYLC